MPIGRALGLAGLLLVGANLVLTQAGTTPAVVVPLCQRPFARGEWGTDVLVEVSLSRVPAVGQAATLAVEVCAKRAGVVRLEVVLPSGFAWVVLPEGFAAGDRMSRNPANFGRLHVASGTRMLAALEPVRLTGIVRALEPGFATVTATASPDTGIGDSSSVYPTVRPRP